MLSYHELYELFERLDAIEGVWESRIGRWRAWPAAKMALLWHFMSQHESTMYSGAPRSIASRVLSRLEKYGPAIRLGLSQGRQLQRASSAEVAFLVTPRPYRYPDEKIRDFIFDDLLEGEGQAAAPAVVKYSGEDNALLHTGGNNDLRLDPLILWAEHLAIVLMQSRSVRVAAKDIGKLVLEAGAPASIDILTERARIGIALFEARRRVSRRYFERLGCRLIVLTYGPGRMGELAAASELGMPVLELQHGMIGTNCPDYHWPLFANAWRDEIPLPTRIGVYGKIFSDNLTQNAFWRQQDVSNFGGAAIDRFRHLSSPRSRPGDGALRLLFMTQPTSRFAALTMLRNILAETNEGELKGLKLSIKLHPDEQKDQGAYREVSSYAPERCVILPNDTNPLAAIIDADVVASFNSLSLAEAIGLGIPAISILGGPTPEGFAELFGMRSIVDVMPHVTGVQEFVSAIEKIKNNPEYHAKLALFSERLFAPGFHIAAKRAMSELMGQ